MILIQQSMITESVKVPGFSTFPVKKEGHLFCGPSFLGSGSATAEEGRGAGGEGPAEAKGQSEQRSTGHGQSGRLGHGNLCFLIYWGGVVYASYRLLLCDDIA